MTKFEGNRYLKYNLSSTWIYQPNESKINGKGNELIRALYFLKNRHERSRKDTIYKRSYQIEWTKKKRKNYLKDIVAHVRRKYCVTLGICKLEISFTQVKPEKGKS